jgi:hypothetical protein
MTESIRGIFMIWLLQVALACPQLDQLPLDAPAETVKDKIQGLGFDCLRAATERGVF